MSAAKSGERAGNFLVSDLGTAAKAGNGQPAKPAAAKRGEQSDLRAAARSRVVCARAAPDRVFLSLTPSHFFPPSEMGAPSVPEPSDHSPQVEGGIVFLRQLSPSGVSLCVSRSCIASCFSADRLSKFHGAQAYSG